MTFRARIESTGLYVPDLIVTNADLRQFPSDSIPLIEAKTGMKTRRHAAVDQCTSDLALCAAKNCLEKARFDPKYLDGIILSTSFPDRLMPATATRVQSVLGARNAFAFDVNSVCSGALYAVAIANAMIKAGECHNILVVASEVYSRILNPNDFSTYPYFGDGAAALLLTRAEKEGWVIVDAVLKTDGNGSEVIQVPAGGSKLPAHSVRDAKDCYFKMKGREVFEFAVDKGSEIIEQILEKNSVVKDQVQFIMPHQANINVVKEIAKRTGFGEDRFIVNLDRYANTASASVLMAVHDCLEGQRTEPGRYGVAVAFGGGLSWAAALIKF